MPASLGAGLRTGLGPAGLASPLASLGKNRRYVLRLPSSGDTGGMIVIDPTPAHMARFQTLVQLPSGGVPAAITIPAWDDTQVPFCLNAVCSVGILDTGAPTASIPVADADDDTLLGVPAGAARVPANTDLNLTVGKTATAAFRVGSPPTQGIDTISLKPHAPGSGASAGSNLGVLPFRRFDVMYDDTAGQIGLASKLN